MPVPDPPWKIRTQPCPFYSSGRCLFASGCNFQHIVRSSLTLLGDAPRETNKIGTTREHVPEKPRNLVDSDSDNDNDSDNDEDGTVNWSKQNSYALPSIDRHSLTSGSSRSHTETGTVRGRPLSLDIPNVSSGDSLNDDTLVDTTNSAELEDEEDELEERQMSILFSDTHYQTTPFDLDTFRASAIFEQQPHHAPTTPPTVADPPSPPPSKPRLQYNGTRTRTWSDDSDGTSSRRSSLLSEDLGGPTSEYQELEIVNTQPPLRGEFQLTLPKASSLIANRTSQGRPSRLSARARDSDSDPRPSPLADEPEREQIFNTPPRIPEHDQRDSFDASISPKSSPTDSDYDQLPWFITDAPLTLEPPTPSAEESSLQARQRFHKAFTLVTKELRERVKHFREPGTPSPVSSFQPAAESGDGGELEVMSVQGASESAPPQGGAAGNNARQGQEPGYLISTILRSDLPLVYGAVEEPSMDREAAPEEPKVVARLPFEADPKSPPWLKPLRLSSVFPGGRGPLIFQPPQVPQQVPQLHPDLRSPSPSQVRSRTQTQTQQPPTPLSSAESHGGSATSSRERPRTSRRSIRPLAAAVVDHGPVFVPPQVSLHAEIPPVPALPESIVPSSSPFTSSAYAFPSSPLVNSPPSPLAPSVQMWPPVAPTSANEAPDQPLASQMIEGPYRPLSTRPPSLNLSTWEPHWPRRPSAASSDFSGVIPSPDSRRSSVFQFRVHGRNETNSTNLSVPTTPDMPRVPPTPSIPWGRVRTQVPTSRSHSIASLKSNPRTSSPLQRSASPVPSTSASPHAPRSIYAHSLSGFSCDSVSPSVQTSIKHPRLFFAIAAAQPEEVARLLQTGEAGANETVGPEDMHALKFAIESLKDGNEGDLSKKEEIVTTLLSYGADPSAVKNEGNAYIKYFLDKASKSPVIPEEVTNQDAMEEAPLSRARFVIIGQEYGVRELVRSYRAHVRLAKYLADDETELPFVAVLTGPSGHGKTHLATRVGSLLGTTSYSINMTLVRSQREFWETVSSRPDEATRFSSLREYLTACDGKPGVIVVDELEKVHDKAYLQALLVPWETGRVQGITGHPSRSVDISKIVWICTSNVASQDIVKHSRESPQTQEWFEGLRLIARIQLGDELGASLLARVSVVVPFVTFTEEERLAISSQALSGLKRNLAKARAEHLHKVTNWEGVVARAAKGYVEPEGARSIRRGIVKWTDVILRGERLS